MRASKIWLVAGLLLTFSVVAGKLYHGFTWTQWRALTRADQAVTDSTLTHAKAYTDTLDSIQQLTIDTLAAKVDTLYFTGMIIMFNGAVGSIPAGWQLCNGTNGTPDLRNRFVVGAGSGYAVDSTGGTATHTHTIDSESTHTHVIDWEPGVGLAEGVNLEQPLATGAGSAHTHTESTESNLPPYYALCYIMKL